MIFKVDPFAMKYERGTRLGHTLFPGSHCHTCTVNISLVQYRVHPQLMHPPQKSPLLTLHPQKSPLLIILRQLESPLAHPILAQLLVLLEVELLLVKQLLKVNELIVVHNWVCEVVPTVLSHLFSGFILGLKPLIYTVASVILLGTLAIVAIITCWIRARRSFHNRIIRPNNTPQDYLDYISDNEFTPLTTSEFMASLQERPPTYNQSEEMTQQSDEAGNTNAQDRSTTETGGDSAVQSGGTQTAPTTNEGTLVERRRQRGPGRERQRRRRRVVIVENGEGQSGESSVTLASVSPGQVVVTQEEDPSQGQGMTGDHPAQPQSANPGGGDSTAGGNNVTVFVNLQLPSLVTAEPSAQPGSSPDVPTQQEIDAIEARVNMLEVLSSPPFNSHRTSPSASAPSTSAADSVETAENNLIDFSSSPPPSTLPTSLDLDSL